MYGKPLEQHRWLEQLVGDWQVQQHCSPPGGETTQNESEMSCHLVGGLWLIGESRGTSEQGDWTCLLTLGFDPRQDAYVGTFIGSMMNHLWHYKGTVEPCGDRLPLHTQGPTFDDSGIAKYRDTIEIMADNQWRFTSEIQEDAGPWRQIMTATHRRR